MPSGTPTKTASSTDDNPTASDTRLPWMMRLNMSRPNWSVPSQWVRLGASNISFMELITGSYGASTSAKIATSTSSTTIPRPNNAV